MDTPNLAVGDRVAVPGGQSGTVVAIADLLVTVNLDTTEQQTFVAKRLTKIAQGKFKTGDRVVARTGDAGTVVSVKGNLAKVLLDSLATKTVALSFLARVENGDITK